MSGGTATASAVAALALAVAGPAIAGCGGRAGSDAVVLRLESADPRGPAHAPAVADFVRRVARLSDGRLRVDVDLHRGGQGYAAADEPGVLRDVARGTADLGAASTRSFPAIGVRSFAAFDAPGLVDGYRVQAAVLASDLPRRMLAGTRAGGVEGLALLPGPLSRPVGTRAPLRGPADFRGLAFGLRPSPDASRAVAALGAHPLALSADTLGGLYYLVGRRRAPQAAYEDDLDGLFFDRDDDARPWVTANVALWARPVAVVANPRRLRSLTAEQRGWLERAAADAARAPPRAGRDIALAPELCSAGIHIVLAPPSAIAGLRRAWRATRARLARHSGLGAELRRIAALRRRAGPDPGAPVPAACGRPPRPEGGVRSPLPNGIYRTRITEADVRAAGWNENTTQPGTQTLTLRNGHWRLVITEPGRYEERGTYAGTPLRTILTSGRAVIRDLAYVSVTGDRDSLRFGVGHAPSPFWSVVFGSHPWRRIGG